LRPRGVDLVQDEKGADEQTGSLKVPLLEAFSLCRSDHVSVAPSAKSSNTRPSGRETPSEFEYSPIKLKIVILSEAKNLC
jgi:hypothetical protein